MRKCALIVLAVLFLAVFAGCTGSNSGDSSKTTGADGKSSIVSNANKSQQTTANNTNSSDQGAEVIVKSNNQISSKDKEIVLNEISNELDTMIKDINSAEDVSDNDLN